MVNKAHFKTLVHKNFLLFRKNCCGSCCEVVTPIFFALMLIFINNNCEIITVPEYSFLSNS